MGVIATEPAPKLVNARTAAEIVGYSVYTLRRLAASGALPAVRLGPHGHLRFRLSDLDRFVAADRLPRAVDLAAGVIRIERSYDPRACQIVAPKSQAGFRKVPIASVLRAHLATHRLRSGRSDGFVFGEGGTPFDDGQVRRRAVRTWKAGGLVPIGLHECRHTFASLMIGAGANVRALASYMGHASVTITLDRYGHLMPGNEEEAAGLLDAYLSRSEVAARI